MDVKNSKTRGTKSIIIDKEQYKNLLTMFTASKEDVDFAFQCIKNMDALANIVPILLLRKHSKCDFSQWTNVCKKHISYQYSLGIENYSKMVSYEEIYKKIIKNKDAPVSKEHIEIFTDDISEFFKKNLVRYEFIKDVQIKVKIK
jgi:hypothetical protein